MLTTSLIGTDDSMSFYEAGQYQFVIQGQNCTASVGRYRTFKLLQRVVEAPKEPVPSPSASAPAQETERCKTLGAPSKLDIRPTRKLLRAGEEFTFRATLYDSAGCYLPQHVTWALGAGADRVDMTDGTVHVHDDSNEGEATVTATAAGRTATATVEIASTERYDALLRSGEWSPTGEGSAAAPAAATKSLGAAAAVAQKSESGNKKIFVAIVCAIAIALATVAILLWRRARRAAMKKAEEAAQRHAEEVAAYEAMAAEQALAAEQARIDQSRVAAASRPPAAPPVAKTICPVCGTQYTTNAKFCGKDGAVLMPLNR
jgi:hypothetical protein